MKEEPTKGTLAPAEPHPMAHSAMAFIRSIPFSELMLFMDSFATCAIEGNRNAEICTESLRRLLNGQPVSDRYLLGLAWAIMEIKIYKEG